MARRTQTEHMLTCSCMYYALVSEPDLFVSLLTSRCRQTTTTTPDPLFLLVLSWIFCSVIQSNS
jgi:hypothetical protein